ncbi:MAG TPA: NAD(P)H-binding protein [Chitinophagaceae bacterium]|nr:NAD(P)H-binding protein [Chitinophagaceae bacterium]
MSAKTATIIGVTGLIGGCLYELLKEDKSFETIRLIVRRPMPKDDARTEIKLVDFNDAESLMLAIDGSDAVFCTVGTTNKKVKGDNEAYRKVDYDIPVKAARFCKMRGCETFLLVSAIGANSKSNNFYLRLKGEVEEAVKETGLQSIHFMRPSFLLGHRKENRPGETIGKVIMKATSPFLLAGLRKYRPIHAKLVARAMINVAKENRPGIFVYEYDEIKAHS